MRIVQAFNTVSFIIFLPLFLNVGFGFDLSKTPW